MLSSRDKIWLALGQDTKLLAGLAARDYKLQLNQEPVKNQTTALVHCAASGLLNLRYRAERELNRVLRLSRHYTCSTSSSFGALA